MPTTIADCETCTEAGLLACTCDFYTGWTSETPKIPPWLGVRAESFRFGHRAGRSDAARRLWKHLTPEGKTLATAIANEGDDG